MTDDAPLLVKVWYVRGERGAILGVFRTADAAEASALNGSILEGWLATENMETGYLVSHAQLLRIQ